MVTPQTDPTWSTTGTVRLLNSSSNKTKSVVRAESLPCTSMRTVFSLVTFITCRIWITNHTTITNITSGTLTGDETSSAEYAFTAIDTGAITIFSIFIKESSEWADWLSLFTTIASRILHTCCLLRTRSPLRVITVKVRWARGADSITCIVRVETVLADLLMNNSNFAVISLFTRITNKIPIIIFLILGICYSYTFKADVTFTAPEILKVTHSSVRAVAT
mmetsp:Transcript_87546/g.120630  ORF Transcript_87546/g.120630 Transcript_87546/m.120630 type:complete len:220 (-) Transcript_87546:3205-3864(-)